MTLLMNEPKTDWSTLVAGAVNAFYIGDYAFNGSLFGLEFYPHESLLMLCFRPPCCLSTHKWEDGLGGMECGNCNVVYDLYAHPASQMHYGSLTFSTLTGLCHEPQAAALRIVEPFLRHWGYNSLEETLYGAELIAQLEALATALPTPDLEPVEKIVWHEYLRRQEEGLF